MMPAWLRLWRPRARRERDLDDELQFHVDSQIRDLIAEGVPELEARRRALAAFGSVDAAKGAARAVMPWSWIADLANDGRQAHPTIRRQPGFACVAVLTLALGIGANSAIFSVVNAVLLKPLPVRDPHQLVLFSGDVSQGTVSGDFPEGTWSLFSTDIYEFLKARPLPTESIAAVESGDFRGPVRLPGEPAETSSVATIKFVSGNYFQVLGAPAATGRSLREDDDLAGAPQVAVVSDRFWRNRLHGAPTALGQVLVIDGAATTVVGIMPPAFFGERVRQAPDIWIPLIRRDAAVRDRTDYYWLTLIGRLRPGETLRHAEAATTEALRVYLSQQTGADPRDDIRARIERVGLQFADGSRGISLSREQNKRLLGLLLAAVGLVLLIASANVGTLFLTRAASREREIAVRRALGASGGRLARQWLTESTLLGLLGGIAGLIVAAWLAPVLLPRFMPASTPIAANIDGRVFAFGMATTLLACTLFGLSPALQASRTNPVFALRLVGRAARRRRVIGLAEPFVVVQIALSVVVVLVAALLVRTLANLERAPLGFDRTNVLLVSINPRPAHYTAATAPDLYTRLEQHLSRVPGVAAVSYARYSPFSGSNSSNTPDVEGYTPPPGLPARTETVLVGPNYPATIGMPVVQGRSIAREDTNTTTRVAMVNEAFVRHFSGGSSLLGRHVTLQSGTYAIVGVLRDAQFHSARASAGPMLFLPMQQETSAMALDCELEVRTHGDANAIAGAVRTAIGDVDGRVAIGRTRTLGDQVSAAFAAEQTAATFIAVFAMLALTVASIGVYGVVSQGLASRTSELGVRVALGASRAHITWLVIRGTVWRVIIGLALGAISAQAASRALAGQLFGVTTADMGSLAATAVILASTAALAVLRPLRIALRIDPSVSLRAE
jgi:predicted permease